MIRNNEHNFGIEWKTNQDSWQSHFHRGLCWCAHKVSKDYLGLVLQQFCTLQACYAHAYSCFGGFLHCSCYISGLGIKRQLQLSIPAWGLSSCGSCIQLLVVLKPAPHVWWPSLVTSQPWAILKIQNSLRADVWYILILFQCWNFEVRNLDPYPV